MPEADLDLFFDPVCPFCWITSRWVVEVARLRELTVRWRPISLWLLNRDGADPTQPLSRMHLEGLAQLRVVAAVEREHGPEPIGALYTALGSAIWDAEPPAGGGFGPLMQRVGGGQDVTASLASVGLSAGFAAARQDTSLDAIIDASTNEALARVGGGVGTPVLSFAPPDGPAFFGPVLSRIPRGDDALALFDAVTTLAHTPSFAELKRSQREMPDLPVLAGAADEA